MGSQHPSACPQALQGLGLGGLGGFRGASRETRDTLHWVSVHTSDASVSSTSGRCVFPSLHKEENEG